MYKRLGAMPGDSPDAMCMGGSMPRGQVRPVMRVGGMWEACG